MFQSSRRFCGPFNHVAFPFSVLLWQHQARWLLQQENIVTQAIWHLFKICGQRGQWLSGFIFLVGAQWGVFTVNSSGCLKLCLWKNASFYVYEPDYIFNSEQICVCSCVSFLCMCVCVHACVLCAHSWWVNGGLNKKWTHNKSPHFQEKEIICSQ